MRFAVPTIALFGSNPCTDIFSSPVLSTLCAYEISIPFSCTFVKSNRETIFTFRSHRYSPPSQSRLQPLRDVAVGVALTLNTLANSRARTFPIP